MKYFKFHLYKNDIEFLEVNIKDDSVIAELRAAKEKGVTFVKEKYKTDKYEVILLEKAVLIILDELGDILCANGVDENGELNALGRKIDDYIDIFSVVYY